MSTVSLDTPFKENMDELVSIFAQSISMEAHIQSFHDLDMTPEDIAERAQNAYNRMIDIIDFDGETVGDFIDELKTDEAQRAITQATTSESTVRTLNNHVFATLEHDIIELS